jgi:hypothetical protein
VEEGRCHAECHAAYCSARAPTCVQCGLACVRSDAFCGELRVYKDGTVHEEW